MLCKFQKPKSKNDLKTHEKEQDIKPYALLPEGISIGHIKIKMKLYLPSKEIERYFVLETGDESHKLIHFKCSEKDDLAP